MSRLIAVCGATGQLGGSVTRRMLREGWRVRAITRDVDSKAAQALKAQGAEMVTADYDDESSLIQAFDCANAIFGMTNFWEHLMTLGADGAGRKEYDQSIKIASAASKTPSLEHFVFQTMTAGEKIAGKEYFCAHWDYKDRASDYIKHSLPELAKKTTFLWVGWFPSNMWVYEALKPTEIPGTYGSYVWLQPCGPNAIMHIAGDIDNNVGSFVRAILENPSVSLTKNALMCTDSMRYADIMEIWNKVTGRRGTYVSLTIEQAAGIFGPFGEECGRQFRLNGKESDWGKAHRGEMIGAKELGIEQHDLLDMRASFEKNIDKL